MAEIRPFKALRFNTDKAGAIGELVCPPYDIISEEQRIAYLQRNPHNIIRLELPKGEHPYEEAGETLQRWLTGERMITVFGLVRASRVLGVSMEALTKGLL